MDSFERVFSSLNNEYVDRPPIFAHIGDHAGIINGLTYNVMYQDIEKAAKAHLKTLDLYGYDIITIQVEPSVSVAEACGASVIYPKQKNPWIKKHLITDEADLIRLEIPDFNAIQSTKVMIEGTRILAENAKVPVAAFMTGPITFSLQLMPYKNLLIQIKRNPEFVHRLINKSVQLIKTYISALKGAGAQILVLCEHDIQMFSPIHVKEFSLDYMPDILKIYDYNILHICGKVTPHLNAVADHLIKLEGLNVLSIGPYVDIQNTRKLLNDKIGIAGNIDHIKLLPNGKPEQIRSAVLNAMKSSGGDFRFMVAPGCEITADTPIVNVKAFVDAVKMYHG
jgi:uroporphyrinogen decarboxylase